MLSSPACELKQYIAPAGPDKVIHWADVAQPAVDTYIGQQRIKREELEVFKCVQVQCETQAPQETSYDWTCDIYTKGFSGTYHRRNWRQHIEAEHSDVLGYQCPECCDKTFAYGRPDHFIRHVTSHRYYYR